MSFTPPMAQLKGLSYQAASLYGMPHAGARYLREDMAATAWSGDMRTCACCGKVGGPHSRHHEPPRSKGSFLLDTGWGRFVLLPALIDLCGSGTTGCHGDRHGGLLRIRWEWDGDGAAEAWWSGELLAHGYRPHDPRLFGLGCYVFERGGLSKRYRDESDALWGRWEES